LGDSRYQSGQLVRRNRVFPNVGRDNLGDLILHARPLCLFRVHMFDRG